MYAKEYEYFELTEMRKNESIRIVSLVRVQSVCTVCDFKYSVTPKRMPTKQILIGETE